MKKAILTISFGTSYSEAAQRCILPVERALGAAFPGWPVLRAYTSRMIVRKLRSLGQQIELENEAITRLRQAGCERLFLASTHTSFRARSTNWPAHLPEPFRCPSRSCIQRTI